MQCRELSGHSGCRVILIEDNASVYIRKIAGSEAYNSRLMLQAKKQNDFSPCGYISVPRIYSMDYTPEGLFYFDMEYIKGITLAEYMKVIQVSSIRSIAATIINSFQFSPSAQNIKAPEIFTGKIRSLESALHASNSSAVMKALSVLAAHKWDKFPLSSCHGDMTFENIIVKEGKLYLIDFLDSFYDCWIMDAATLLQDSFAMWSYRNEKQDINTVIRLMIFKDIVTEMIEEAAGISFMLEVYYALLLKLVRIYPYTEDSVTLDFLNRKTKTVMELIERYHENTNNSLCRQ